MGEAVAIDNQRLIDLYGQDLDLVAEVFDASLRLLLNELEHTAVLIEQRNADSIRKWLHKLKPVLGYVCVPALLEEAEQLEGLCQTAPDEAAIYPRFLELERSLSALPEWMINQMNLMRNQGGINQT